MNLTHTLERTIVIEAPPETVFRYFTDSARWSAWWGSGSTIDPQPGGAVYMNHHGSEISGEVIEISPGNRIVFTYGYVSGNPIGPGESRVTVEIYPHPRGTQLRLVHEFADAAARDLHIQGWRFQLSVFSSVVLNEVHLNAEAIIDAWHVAWSITDAARRDAAIRAVAAPALEFRDRYSLLCGLEDVSAHIAAAQRFAPAAAVARRGPARHCQGTVVADWVATNSAGEERSSGTAVYRLGPDGKIFWATSLANG